MAEKLYYYEKTCVDMIFAIYTILQRKFLDKIRDSRFFCIMIDANTYSLCI